MCVVVPCMLDAHLRLSVCVGASAWVAHKGGQHRRSFYFIKYLMIHRQVMTKRLAG